MNSDTTHLTTPNATPAGICEAARAGDVKLIEHILSTRPELLSIDNPHNWTKTVEGHTTPNSYNKKPVEVAAFFNQAKAVTALLRFSHESPDARHPCAAYCRSLRIALAMKHQHVVQAIRDDILNRVDSDSELIQIADRNGYTLIQFAADEGDIALAHALLDRGAPADPLTKIGRRVIHAVLDGSLDDERRDLARTLIQRGADFDLWVACALEDESRVKALLSQDASLANRHHRSDRRELTDGFPLVQACRRGNAAIVRLLLDHGADVNAQSSLDDPPEFGMPIMMATECQHFSIAHLLLDRGASIHAHPNCDTPFIDRLYSAVAPQWLVPGTLEVADDAAPTDEKDAELYQLYRRVRARLGRPYLHTHVWARNYALIERRLRERPEEIRHQYGRGRKDTTYNCLAHAAAWLGDATTMQLCFQLRPDLMRPEVANEHLLSAIRSHNREGSFDEYRRIIELHLGWLRERDKSVTIVPLWRLAKDYLKNYSYSRRTETTTMNELLNLAQLFLDHGAEINERDPKSQHTALSQAVHEGHTEYVAFLLERGASTMRDEPAERSPLTMATKHGFGEIMAMLKAHSKQ